MATDAINKTYDIKTETLQHTIEAAVNAQFFKDIYDKKLQEITKDIKMPGFRPGKVPKGLLNQRYGASLLREVTGEVVQQSMDHILEKENLKMATQPKLDIKTAAVGSDLEYKAEFESFPTIEPIDFKKIKLKKAVVDLSEKELEALAKEAIKNAPSWQESKKPAKDNDKVTIDYSGAIDGELFDGGSAKGASVVLGAGKFLAALEEGIVDMKVGEKKDISVTFPEDYHAAHLAGKEAVFTVTLHKVENPVYAKLDTEWFKKQGSEATTKKDYLVEYKVAQQPMADQMASRVTKKRLEDALTDYVKCPVPETLVQSELGAQAKDEKPSASATKKAQARVKYLLIIQQLAETFNTQVTNADIEKFIDTIVPPGIDKKMFMSWYMQDKNQLEKIKMAVLENKVLDHVQELCQVTEDKMSLESVKTAINKES
jgi:trigger factor